MKTKFFTLTVCSIAFAVILSACSSSKSSTKKYPEQKTNTPGNVGNLPPGQAKKIYGTKSAKVFAPGQRKKNGGLYPIIIVRTPGIIILRHTDGRNYYKNEDNYIYWQGNDDRFYLDEKHLKEVAYDENELNDWKEKGKKEEKKSPPGQKKKEEEKEQHGNGNGKGKEKDKSKKH